MKSIAERLVLITVGAFVMATATQFFFAPYSFGAGGVTQLAIIMNLTFPQISIGTYLLIANIILFIIGVILLGKQFGLLTLFGTLAYSFATIILGYLFPITHPLTKEPVLSLVIGGILMSVGLTIVFMQNASTGGTDILGMVMNRYLHLSLPVATFIGDGSILLISLFTQSLDIALYSFVGIYIQSIIMDQMITGMDRRIVMTITSSQAPVINDFINKEMRRGSTIYQGVGGYSKQAHDIIVTVVHRNEYILIKSFVDQVDKQAFVFVYNANEVLGEGFTYLGTGQERKRRFAFLKNKNAKRGVEE